MLESQFNKRFRHVRLFFILWAAAMAVRLFYFGVIARPKIVQEMQGTMVQLVTIPAKRGRILNSRKKDIASSIRYIDLYIEKKGSLEHDVEIFNLDIPLDIAAVLRRARRVKEGKVLLKKNITAEEYSLFEKKFNHLPYTSRYYFRRLVDRRYKNKVGSVGKIDGVECGLSGLEKKYDHRLRGQDLVYQILVDRKGKEIKGSYRELKALRSGYDVYLKRGEL